MTTGVDNPATGKGKKTDRNRWRAYLEARGCFESKEADCNPGRGDPKRGDPKNNPHVMSEFHAGDNASEEAVGSRPNYGGAKKHDDYFGDHGKMTTGVDNPAAGKGKQTDRIRCGRRQTITSLRTRLRIRPIDTEEVFHRFMDTLSLIICEVIADESNLNCP
ncbi:hypothetical protein H0H92_008188, partial [Tricholoma furcatifolium]